MGLARIYVSLQAILAYNIYDTTPLSVGDYELPTWAQTLGWLMAVAPVALIPIAAVWVVYKSYGDPCYEGLSFGRVSNGYVVTFARHFHYRFQCNCILNFDNNRQ